MEPKQPKQKLHVAPALSFSDRMIYNVDRDTWRYVCKILMEPLAKQLDRNHRLVRAVMKYGVGNHEIDYEARHGT